MTTPTRRRLTALTGTLALGAGLVLATPLVPTALAAPVASATYTAGAGSGIVDLSSLSLVGLNLATAQVGAASATASNAPAASAASAKNLGATLVGLPITVDENAQSAPADNASPSSRGLNAVNIPALLSTGVLDTSVQARTATGATCLGDGAALSTSTVGTAGVTVAPGLVPGVIPSLAQVNAVSVASRTSLVAAAGASDTRAVQASSAAQLAGVDILGSNGISVTVAGTPTLTATASGQTATSGVTLTGVDPSTVTVKVAGRAVPVNATGVTT